MVCLDVFESFGIFLLGISSWPKRLARLAAVAKGLCCKFSGEDSHTSHYEIDGCHGYTMSNRYIY